VFKKILLPRVERWYPSFEIFPFLSFQISQEAIEKTFMKNTKLNESCAPHLKEALQVIPAIRKMDPGSFD
jgi:hypothetical protein